MQVKQHPGCVLDQLGYGVFDTFKGEDTGVVETNSRGGQLTRSKKKDRMEEMVNREGLVTDGESRVEWPGSFKPG